MRTPSTSSPKSATSWGYRRIHGELKLLGVAIAASMVWEVLKTADVDPAPRRTTVTWADFLRSQAEAILAMDFIETVTPTGQRQYIVVSVEPVERPAKLLGHREVRLSDGDSGCLRTQEALHGFKILVIDSPYQ